MIIFFSFLPLLFIYLKPAAVGCWWKLNPCTHLTLNKSLHQEFPFKPQMSYRIMYKHVNIRVVNNKCGKITSLFFKDVLVIKSILYSCIPGATSKIFYSFFNRVRIFRKNCRGNLLSYHTVRSDTHRILLIWFVSFLLNYNTILDQRSPIAEIAVSGESHFEIRLYDCDLTFHNSCFLVFYVS